MEVAGKRKQGLGGTKKPCYCEKCNGILQNERTERRHRRKSKGINYPTAIPDFLEWQRAQGSRRAYHFNPTASDSESDTDSSSESSGTDSEYESTSSPKRQRIATPLPRINDDGPLQDRLASNIPVDPENIHNDPSDNENNLNDENKQGDESGYESTQSTQDESEVPESEIDGYSDDDELAAENRAALRNVTSFLEQLHAAAAPDLNLVENDLDNAPDDMAVNVISRIENIAISQQFIHKIQSATLDEDKLDPDVLYRLRNPDIEPVDISDADIRLSLDLFIACGNASEATYNGVRKSITQHSPDINILSYYLAKKKVSEISGIDSVLDDMCINSCVAFVGPWAELQECPECSEPRYDAERLEKTRKKVPRQQVCTIPLGPQLQALRRSVSTSIALRYRDEKMGKILDNYQVQPVEDRVYDDMLCGRDFRNFSRDAKLTVDDITVSFSLDGAQLYQNKKSDTWIAIWMVNDLDPTIRYKLKHVLPAIVIPGPNKPKILDSFLFRSMYHLSALQRENGGAGIRMWNAAQERIVLSRIAFVFGTADAVGLTELDGRVGHHGAQGCRMSCDMKGRHKPNSGHYCAAHLCPNDYSVVDCQHPDYNFRAEPTGPSPEVYKENLASVVASEDQASYERNRKSTGISKLSILSGLYPKLTLPIPKCFTVDLMHLLFLNLGDLLISLWRGQLRCDPTDSKEHWDWAVLVGNVWTEHGKLVSAATKYFPSSFHRPPRDPAEKISSGYKATEYNLYLFGLGPALFRTVLPKKYWRNFCKLVYGVRIIIQRSLTGNQIREAHLALTQFVEEFEHLYYQRRVDRLHFCRPSLHTLLHTALECSRTGPGTYVTQFRMERAIGDFSRSIRQPSNIFGNLCQVALRMAQLNALKSMCPELDPTSLSSLPNGSHNCGGDFVLLRPGDRYTKILSGQELDVVHTQFRISKVRRWGRLKLPNGQIARSVYSEKDRRHNTRNSRNVKAKLNGKFEFAEVQFYFMVENYRQDLIPYALVSIYGAPDPDLLQESSNTLWACSYQGDAGLTIISVTAISSVVSMQPLPKLMDDEDDRWFVVEKSGIDDVEFVGDIDILNNDREDNDEA